MTAAAQLEASASTSTLATTVALHVRVVTGAGGGPDKTILRSPRYLRDHGYEELCAYLRPPGDALFSVLEDRALAADAELIAIDDRGPLDWRVVRQLIRICRERQVSIWHGHDYKSNALGLLVKKFVPLRLVTTVHGWVQHTWRTPLYYWVDRWSLRSYERVICVSDDLRVACIRAGVPESRCMLLANGIETDEYRRTLSAEQAKRQLGLPTDRIVLGGIGRLSAEKGFDRLLAAVKHRLDSGDNLHLVILGDGAEREALQQQIHALQLGDHLQLVGHQNNIPLWLQAMDLFVLSSLREGLPNVLLEAMAMETPVLATDVGGVSRLIEHDHNGWLIPAGDNQALIEGIVKLIAEPLLRDRLANAARRSVVERYDFAVRMRQMRAIYDELLDRSSAS